MAWPIQVARNAPAMPSTVVRIKPLGLFWPGERMRAMMPATKPTTMIQIMPPISVPFQCINGEAARRARRGVRAASDPARQFVLVRQPSVRRQMVDDIGQELAEAFQQFVAGQAALGGERLD